MRRFRPIPSIVFILVVSALVGGIFGRNALAVDEKVPEHYRTFTAALNAIESSYVDKVPSERLVYSAVRGMLATLDPHSSFFDPTEYARMRERVGVGRETMMLYRDFLQHYRRHVRI